MDAASLIATAVKNTGLDNFGSDDWRGPFEALVQAYDDEANLNLMGRIMTRSDLLAYLQARLRVEEAYRLHPDIEEQQIKAPLWIMGQGRTGTSILQKLMALDPTLRTLRTYEVLFPIVEEAGADGEDPRIARAEQRMAPWNNVAPEVRGIHDFGGGEPMETIMAEAMSFQQPSWLNLLGLTPGFNASLGPDTRRNSLSYARRVLKLLQWQGGGSQWVLKSPDSLSYLPDVLAIFPDVRFIWAHRDPIIALSSAVNMIGTFVWARSDVVPPAGLFDFITDPKTSAMTLSNPIDWIEAGAVPAAQICNVNYAQLIADPLQTLETIYRDVGIEFGAEARSIIGEYLAKTHSAPRATHKYDKGSSEQISTEREYFRRYQDYFVVASEM